jgi:hypothetical protein
MEKQGDREMKRKCGLDIKRLKDKDMKGKRARRK